MNLWLVWHLVCVGAWLGCVLTEALFERAMLSMGLPAHRPLANLHWRVDLWIEIPAFGGVLASGVCLVLQSGGGIDAMLRAKVVVGTLAVALNLWCVGLVWRRRARSAVGDQAGFARIDQAQHRWGAGVLLALLSALALAAVRRLLLTT